MVMDKPFFCPLFREYYNKIKNGVQDCEIRPLDHRGWNLKNIYSGRKIHFSLGYGKQDRTLKIVHAVTVTNDLPGLGIPKWHIDAVNAIYPHADAWLVAHV